MPKIYYTLLVSLLFISINSSGKKSEEEIGVFTRLPDNEMPQEFQDYMVWVQKMNHKFNLAEPETEEFYKLMQELFNNQIGEKSSIRNPVTVVEPNKVKMGKNSIIMNNALLMASGGIEIGDCTMVAAHAKLISNDHDLYDRRILTMLPIKIGNHVWVGAGATILKGVTVGDHAIIGGGSIVTKDVPPYAVVVGNPAKVVKYLDPEKFEGIEF